MSDDKKDFTPPVVTPKDPPTVVKGPPKPTQLPAEKEKAEILKKVGEILAEYDNKESNIPLNHEYWDLMNRYRSN